MTEIIHPKICGFFFGLLWIVLPQKSQTQNCGQLSHHYIPIAGGSWTIFVLEELDKWAEVYITQLRNSADNSTPRVNRADQTQTTYSMEIFCLVIMECCHCGIDSLMEFEIIFEAKNLKFECGQSHIRKNIFIFLLYQYHTNHI